MKKVVFPQLRYLQDGEPNRCVDYMSTLHSIDARNDASIAKSIATPNLQPDVSTLTSKSIQNPKSITSAACVYSVQHETTLTQKSCFASCNVATFPRYSIAVATHPL